METKVCTKCNKELPIENFGWRNKEKGTRRSDCRRCRTEFMKNFYAEKRSIIAKMKSEIKCQKCGESKDYMLDFHHLDPTQKEGTIAKMMNHTYNVDKILNEIKKCVVLCSNCHREFHYLEDNYNITIDEYLSDNSKYEQVQS